MLERKFAQYLKTFLKENSDKIIDIKLKLSKNKQIYETKFTIDIINFKGEDI